MNKFTLMALLCLMSILCSCEKTELIDFEVPATEQMQEEVPNKSASDVPPDNASCGGNGIGDINPVKGYGMHTSCICTILKMCKSL